MTGKWEQEPFIKFSRTGDELQVRSFLSETIFRRSCLKALPRLGKQAHIAEEAQVRSLNSCWGLLSHRQLRVVGFLAAAQRLQAVCGLVRVGAAPGWGFKGNRGVGQAAEAAPSQGSSAWMSEWARARGSVVPLWKTGLRAVPFPPRSPPTSLPHPLTPSADFSPCSPRKHPSPVVCITG